MVFGIWLPERYGGRGRCGFYFFGNSPSMTRAMRSAMSDISGCPSQRARAVMPRWSAKKSSSIRGSSPHPEGVAVVERHPCGCETLLAVGPQFDAHESRHPRRIAFCGGEGLDAGREACGCISPAEQLARCGVEPCGVRLRIAGAAPGEVDRLI